LTAQRRSGAVQRGPTPLGGRVLQKEDLAKAFDALTPVRSPLCREPRDPYKFSTSALLGGSAASGALHSIS